MTVIPDHAIMLYDCPRVNDRVLPNLRAVLHNRPGHDLGAIVNVSLVGQICGLVDDGRELAAHLPELIEYRFPPAKPAGLLAGPVANPVGEDIVGLDYIVRPDNRNASLGSCASGIGHSNQDFTH
jgi:hypothetical protein